MHTARSMHTLASRLCILLTITSSYFIRGIQSRADRSSQTWRALAWLARCLILHGDLVTGCLLTTTVLLVEY